MAADERGAVVRRVREASPVAPLYKSRLPSRFVDQLKPTAYTSLNHYQEAVAAAAFKVRDSGYRACTDAYGRNGCATEWRKERAHWRAADRQTDHKWGGYGPRPRERPSASTRPRPSTLLVFSRGRERSPAICDWSNRASGQERHGQWLRSYWHAKAGH